MTLPPYVVPKRSRSGKIYYYFRTQNPETYIRLPDPYHDKGFAEKYAECMGQPVPQSDPETITSVMDAHKESIEYRALSKSSKTSRDRAFKLFGGTFGKFKVSQLEPKHVRVWRDRFADTPAAANRYLDDISAFFKWAVELGYRTDNPCREISHLKRTGGYEPWPLSKVSIFLEKARPHIAEPCLIALCTAQRQGDVLRINDDEIVGDLWSFRSEKSNQWTEVTLTEEVMALIRTIRARRGRLELVNSRGKPWTKDGYKTAFAKERKRLDLHTHQPRLTFHGFRATAATHARDGGATTAQLAALLGHATERMALHYARRADKKRQAAGASALLPKFGDKS